MNITVAIILILILSVSFLFPLLCALPPKSILRLKKLWPHARKQGHEIGDIFRVGYYSPQDGLDCVWLVNDEGDYNWTSDHEWIEEKFEIIELSDETEFYGESKAPLGKRKLTEPVK